jgi:small subunit ribosomal protein S6e
MALKIVLNDSKTKESYNVEVDDKTRLSLIGKKIKDELDLSVIVPGLKGKITGGSDKQGFPLSPKLDSERPKKILTKIGFGFKSATKKGQRKRVRVSGRIITENTQQVNVKITEGDTSTLREKYPKKEKTDEDKKSKKKKKK